MWVLENMRNLVIGDIHGALLSLKQCLERSEFNNKLDRIIFLGDYVDGWSESSELIEFLINLQLESNNRHIFIRGNHDKWAEDWVLKGKMYPGWLVQGGQSTVDSYIKSGLLMKESHKEFFKNLLNFYVDDKNRGFVHGGFNSKKGLGYEVYDSDYYWDRDMWELALLSHGRFHEEPNLTDGLSHGRRFERHKEIYIGHTSTCNWNCKPHLPEYKMKGQPSLNGPIMVPMNRCNVWNMDTGSGFYGKLTIMDIDSKEYWQSDLSKDNYPNEKGR